MVDRFLRVANLGAGRLRGIADMLPVNHQRVRAQNRGRRLQPSQRGAPLLVYEGGGKISIAVTGEPG